MSITLKSAALTLAAGTVLTLSGCGSSEASGGEGDMPADVDITTEEEAAAEASSEIDESNADEAFEALKESIEEG